MLSLNDKLIESKIKIEDYNRILEDKRNISNLQKYNIDIKRINDSIIELNLLVEALETTIADKISLEPQMRLRQSLKSFLEKLRSEQIDKLGTSYLQYISSIQEYVGIVKNEYKGSWKVYYEEEYRSSINLLNMLNSILKDNEIMKIRNDIMKFNEKWPISSKDLKELKESDNKAYSKIKDLNLNDNIQSFLEKLLKNKIKLVDIDEEIYKWLKANNLIDKIKLSI